MHPFTLYLDEVCVCVCICIYIYVYTRIHTGEALFHNDGPCELGHHARQSVKPRTRMSMAICTVSMVVRLTNSTSVQRIGDALNVSVRVRLANAVVTILTDSQGRTSSCLL